MRPKISITDLKKSLGEGQANTILIQKIFALEVEKFQISTKIKEVTNEELKVLSQIEQLNSEMAELEKFQAVLNMSRKPTSPGSGFQEKLIRDYLSQLDNEGVDTVSLDKILLDVFNGDNQITLRPIIGKIMAKMEGWVMKYTHINRKAFRIYRKIPSFGEKNENTNSGR